ncbi:MAG: hypothetical protein AAF919_03565 [Pseudomonadota bacterium]
MKAPAFLDEWRAARRRKAAGRGKQAAALEAILRTEKVFVHIPKCGGKSVIRDLYGLPEHDWFGHAEAPFYEQLLGPSRFAAFHSFTFMRDPVDRCRSAFEFYRTGGFQRPAALKLAAQLEPYDFVSFAMSDLLADLVTWQVVFRPQAPRLMLADGRLGVDRIYDFAAFGAALNRLTGRAEDTPVAHVNASQPYKRAPIPEAVTKRLHDLYREDVILMQAHGLLADGSTT